MTIPKPQRPDHGSEIRLRIRDVNQLFHTLDPFPFRERDLDAQVEEYIVGWAREAAHREPVSVIVQMPLEQARREEAGHIAEAFQNYFTGRAQVLDRELRALFKNGRDALLIGLIVLGLTIALGGVVSRAIPEGFARRFVEDGLIIVGWVANWKPIEIFLFEWWPITRKQALYRRLANARLEIQGEPPGYGDAERSTGDAPPPAPLDVVSRWPAH